MVSPLGSQITAVALPFQVYALTRSPFAVGLVGLVEVIPLLSLAFWGGALADARDRRSMVLVTEVVFLGIAGVLCANALLPRPLLWPLYIVAGLQAGLYAIQRPSLDSLPPRLIPRDEMAAASALGNLRGTVAMIAGPALAGVLIASFGLPVTYAIDPAESRWSCLVSCAPCRRRRTQLHPA